MSKRGTSFFSKVGRGGYKTHFKGSGKRRKFNFSLDIGSDVVFDYKDAILLGRVTSKIAESKYIVIPNGGGDNEVHVTWQNNPHPVNDVKLTSTTHINIGDVVLVQHSLDMNFVVLVPSTVIEINKNHLWVKPDDKHSRLCIKIPICHAYHTKKNYKLDPHLSTTNISPSDINIVKLMLLTTQAELVHITKVKDHVQQQLTQTTNETVILRSKVSELTQLYKQSCTIIQQLTHQLLQEHKTSHQMATLQATLLQKEEELTNYQKQLISSQAEVADLRLQVQTQELELQHLSNQLDQTLTTNKEELAAQQTKHDEQIASLKATHQEQLASEKAKQDHHLETRPTPLPNIIEARPAGNDKRMATYMRLEVPGPSNPSSEASAKSLARRAKQLEEVCNLN